MLCSPGSTPWSASARHSPAYRFPARVCWHCGPERSANPQVRAVRGPGGYNCREKGSLTFNKLSSGVFKWGIWKHKTKPPWSRSTTRSQSRCFAAPPPPTPPHPDRFSTACTTNGNFPVAFIFYWWAIKSPACPINASIIVSIYLSPSPGKDSGGGKQKSKCIKEASETRVSTHLRSQIKVNS